MINGPLMFQYLINLLSQGRNGPGSDFPLPGMMPPGADGRWGDYVFNQDGMLPSIIHESDVLMLFRYSS